MEVMYQKVLQKIADKNLTLVTAESCTGGLLGATITNYAGSSKYYLGGFITYSNKLKQTILGVSQDSLISYGAVSEKVASEMSLGAKKNTNANISIAITGLAGPQASENKPIGMVCFSFIIGTIFNSTEYFIGERDQIRKQSINYVFNFLQKKL